MTDTPNPYQSPKPLEPFVPWWKKLAKWFRSEAGYLAREFLDGRMLVVEGIAFSIDPDNEHVLYAASPSNSISESRLKLVVSEAMRLLPDFMQQHPSLRSHLKQRDLIVRLVHNYADAQSGSTLKEYFISRNQWRNLDGTSVDDLIG